MAVYRDILDSIRPSMTLVAPSTQATVAGTGPGSVAGWQCAILTVFGLPCTQAGLHQGIRQGIAALTGGDQQTTAASSNGCSSPMVKDESGICVFPGSPGDVSTGGTAVMGAFGMPAQQAVVIGEIHGRPVRRCNPGLVLGKDNLCYPKGSLPRMYRKWKPAPRPAISAADTKAINRADRAKQRVKRLASKVGYACHTKGRRK